MPKSDKPWITFRPTQEEADLLEDYCYLKRLTKTEVLRSLIRDLRAEEGENGHEILSLSLGKSESKLLENYCTQNGMTKLAVLRGLIQNLKNEPTQAFYSYVPKSLQRFHRCTISTPAGTIDALGYDGEGNVVATFTVPPELAKELSQKMTNVSVGYTVNHVGAELSEAFPDEDSKWGDKKWEGNDKSTVTHNDPKVQRWLDSLKTESDVASLRSMAQQMLAIAERLGS